MTESDGKMKPTPSAKMKAAPSTKKRAGAKAGAKKERPQEVEELCGRLFQLSDKDNSGTIEFREFLLHHRSIMSISDFAGAGDMDDAKLEVKFREHDTDNSQSLDLQEFLLYMDGVFGVLGKRKFIDVSEALIDETSRKLQAIKQAFDPPTSERMVEKARGAHRILPDIVQAMQVMLDKRADPNYADSTGAHTLLYASDKADEDFIYELLQRRANPMVHNKDQDCSAFRAAKSRNIDVLRLLMIPGSTPSSSSSEERKEKEAASEEFVRNMATLDAAGATALVKKGADINFRDSSGWTPLTAAVFWGKADIVDVLLRSQSQYTKATSKLRLDAMNGKGRQALHIAARKGRGAILGTLVKARCHLDLQDADGWTALHHAAFNSEGECLVKLLEGGANPHIQGLHGFTAYMLAKLPSAAGKLEERVYKMLEPSESIGFAKMMLPILKDSSLTLFGRLEALFELSGVHGVPKNLRLYEQMFDAKQGPNKVRILKIWEVLAKPLISRMLSGECDMTPLPANATEEQIAEFERESTARRKEQKAFLKQWLLDSMGPRPSEDWRFDNREAYKEEMYEVIGQELHKFRDLLADTFAKMKELRSGHILVERPAVEVLNKKYTSQLQAHPIPVWLQEMDPAGTFEALRMVGAANMGGDDDTAILAFVDLMTTNMDFDCGKKIWRSVYTLWLESYAKLADGIFQTKIQGLVDRFNAENHKDQTLFCVYKGVAPKSYKKIQVKAAKFGDKKKDDYRSRTLAANVLDVVRCSITVQEPRTALMLIDEVFEPLRLDQQKMELLRVENRFSDECSAEDLMGYRNIELSVLLDAGIHPAACGRPGKTVPLRIIGEVQIVLESFLDVRRKRHLLFKASRGEFDYKTDDAEDMGRRRSAKALAKD